MTDQPDRLSLLSLEIRAILGLRHGSLIALREFLEAGGEISAGSDLAALLSYEIGSGAVAFDPAKGLSKRVKSNLTLRRRMSLGALAYVRIKRSPRGSAKRIFNEIANGKTVGEKAIELAYYEFKNAWREQVGELPAVDDDRPDTVLADALSLEAFSAMVSARNAESLKSLGPFFRKNPR